MLKKPETLFVLGYMLLPLLALLSAIVGLTMILGGNKIAGAIVLVVVTQVFAFGAIFALRRRKAALLPQHEQTTAQCPTASSAASRPGSAQRSRPHRLRPLSSKKV